MMLKFARAILVILVPWAFGVLAAIIADVSIKVAVVSVAVAVGLLYAYIIIHDDLP